MKLSEWRATRGISQDGFGQMVGVYQSTVHRWETGERAPSAGAMRRIIAATNGEVSADDLLEIAPDRAA